MRHLLIETNVLRATAMGLLVGCAVFLSGCFESNDAPERSTEIEAARVKTSEQGQTAAVRVFLRLKVKPNGEDAFLRSWARSKRESCAGSHDCLLLRNRDDSTEFVALHRWQSVDEWQAFQHKGQADAGRIKILSATVMRPAEAFDELHDRLDYTAWKSKMIRIYGLKVTEGKENEFIDTWLQVNMAIGTKVKGARGGLLLRDRRNRSMFLEVVRWDSLDDWRAFATAPPADPEAFRRIFALMTVVSTEVFEEVD